MKKYTLNTEVMAKKMYRGEYNRFRGWKTPEDESPNDIGYIMEYKTGHISWLPKQVFEMIYKEV